MPKGKRAVKNTERPKSVQQASVKKEYILGRGFVKCLIIILILILIALIGFLLVEQGYMNNPFANYGKVEQKFSIKDECSMIVGNLIHQIDDEGICEARCKTNCAVRKMSYVRFEYREAEKDCNICDCYCK